MTVCDLTHAYHTTSGGIRTYIDAKRRYLLDHTGHDHVLIVPGEANGVERDGRATTIRIASPTIPGAAPYRFFARSRRVLDALEEAAPDVVEVATFYMPTEWRPAYAYRRRSRQAGRRSIVAIQAHTDFAASYAEAYARPVVGRRLGRAVGGVAARYVASVLGRADLRLAPSPLQAQRLAEIGIEDVHVVTPGVDTALFTPERADPAVRADLDIPADAVLAAYVGRLDSEKRTATMVDAAVLADRQRPTRLVLAGEGPHREALEAREAAGAPIRVLPYVEDPRALARLLASADLYLTAGPYETFGLSVIEAQACGLPVVGVAAGALTERVPSGLGRLGPVDDAAAMAANLLTVAADPESMAGAARHHVEAHFSWPTTFRHLLDLYADALEQASS